MDFCRGLCRPFKVAATPRSQPCMLLVDRKLKIKCGGSGESAGRIFGHDVDGNDLMAMIQKPFQEQFQKALMMGHSNLFPSRQAVGILREKDSEIFDVTVLPCATRDQTTPFCLVLIDKFVEQTPARVASQREDTPQQSVLELPAYLADPEQEISWLSPTPVVSGDISESQGRVHSGLSCPSSLAYSSSGMSDEELPKRRFRPLITKESQTEAAQATGIDVAVETQIVWGKSGFRCTVCSKPPMPPGGPQLADEARNAAVLKRGAVWRNKQKRARLLDGLWTILLEHIGKIDASMYRLNFDGRKCWDNEGNRFELKLEPDKVLLAGGSLTGEGENILHLDRPNGIRVSYTRGGGSNHVPKLPQRTSQPALQAGEEAGMQRSFSTSAIPDRR